MSSLQDYTSFDPLDGEQRVSKGSFFKNWLPKKKHEIKLPTEKPEVATSERPLSVPDELGAAASNMDEKVPVQTLLKHRHDELGSSCESVSSEVDCPNHNTNFFKQIKLFVEEADTTSKSRSELRRYWMPDENCKECYDCGVTFNTFRRKHHCRICGQIFCGRCSNQFIPGKIVGVINRQRACVHCATTVLKCAQVNTLDSGSIRPADYAKLIVNEMNNKKTSSQTSLSSLVSKNTSDGRRSSLEKIVHKLKFGQSSSGAKLYDIENSTEVQARDSQGVLPMGQSNEDKDFVDILTNTTLRKHSSFPDLVNADTNDIFTFDQNLDLPMRNQFNRDSVLTTEAAYRLSRHRAEAMVGKLDHSPEQLKAIWLSMTLSPRGVPLMNMRTGLHLYKKCASGCHMINWLLEQGKVSNRLEGCLLCETYLDYRFLIPIHKSDEGFFKDDFTTYAIRELSEDQLKNFLTPVDDMECEWEPQWLKDITNQNADNDAAARKSNLDGEMISNIMESTDANFEGRSTFFTDKSSAQGHTTSLTPSLVRLDSATLGLAALVKRFKKTPSGQFDEMSMPDASSDISHNEEDNVCIQQYKRSIREYLHEIVLQEVKDEHLPLHWVDIILDLARRVTENVKPDVKNDLDHMDVRKFVKIKKLSEKICSTEPTESEIFFGVCCSKNVAHKKMSNSVMTPQILILASSIEFQRNENKLTTLESQIMQEEGYLRNCVNKILTLEPKPTVLIVERTVSQLAIDYLLHAGITLVYNVKRSIIDRIARMTQADLVTSLDSLITETRSPRLGVCDSFYVRTYKLPNGHIKSLLFLKAFAMHYGCTVLLKGDSLAHLHLVKLVLHFVILAYYNARKEVSFGVNCGLRLTESSPNHSQMSPVPITNQKRHVSSNSETIDDQSDPLQRPPSRSIPDGILTVQDMMNNRLLSMSFNCPVTPPYLDTVDESKCPLLTHFRRLVDFPFKRQLNSLCKKKFRVVEAELYESNKERPVCPAKLINDPQLHPFQLRALTTNQLNGEDESTYLDFRARGGALRFKDGHEVKVKETPTFRRPPNDAEVEKNKQIELKKIRQQWNPFDIRNHQKISFLFSSYSPSLQATYCVKPWIISMQFYGYADLTLGQFLDQYCFRTPYPCSNTNCETPMIEHLRRFVHGQGSIKLLLRTLDKDISTHPGEIVMWSFCQECKKTSRLVPMSNDTWHLSFAKFLDLHFNNDPVQCHTLGGDEVPCPHSLYQDHFQYFGYKNIAASFKYSPITLYEVYFPPGEISLKLESSGLPDSLVTDAKSVIKQYFGIYNNVKNKMFDLEQKQSVQELLVMLRAMRESLTKEDHDKLRHKMSRIDRILCKHKQIPVKYLSDLDIDSSLPDISLEESIIQLQELIVEIRDYIQKFALLWDSELQEYHNHEKRIERDLKKRQQQLSVPGGNKTSSHTTTADHTPLSRSPNSLSQSKVVTLSQDCVDSVPIICNSTSGMKLTETVTHHHSFSEICEHKFPKHRRSSSCPPITIIQKLELHKEALQSAVLNQALERMKSCPGIDPTSKTPSSGEIYNNLVVVEGIQAALGDEAIYGGYHICTSEEASLAATCSADLSLHTSIDMKSSSIRENQSDETDMERTTLVPSAHTPVTPASLVKSSSELDSLSQSLAAITSSTPTNPPIDGNLLTVGAANQKEELPPKRTTETAASSVAVSPTLHRKSHDTGGMRMKFFNFLNPQGLKHIERPFPPNEHYNLPLTTITPVHVNDHELSSIIAYALSSQEYNKKLKELETTTHHDIRSQKTDSPQHPPKRPQPTSFSHISRAPLVRIRDKEEATIPTAKSSNHGQERVASVLYTRHGSDTSEDSCITMSTDGTKQPPSRPTVTAPLTDSGRTSTSNNTESQADSGHSHIVIDYADSSFQLYCKVYYAREFHALRKLVFPQGERVFIRSLAHCNNWAAQGGKTASCFMKTSDDRFVIKQLSAIELKNFHEISDHYFAYITSVHTNKSLSVLAKIIGVYRIAFKNSVTDISRRMDVVVLENLFYQRQVSPTYDLKGSHRNRLIEEVTSENDSKVLLDQNYVRRNQDNPIYTRWHSKKALNIALQADSKFLTSLMIMDYSLLVGQDKQNKELVVGIIDYLRKYTFDKKVESYLKKAVSAEGDLPTIMNPEFYRRRFLDQMEQYFLLVPDHWFYILERNYE